MFNLQHTTSLLTENDGRICQLFNADKKQLTMHDFINSLKSSAAFRRSWNAILAEQEYDAFRWECMPFSKSNLAKDFECVFLNSQSLERPIEENSFAEHFKKTTDEVLSFPNLGGDCILIVPTPKNANMQLAYCHLAGFCRNANPMQIDSVWERVGLELSMLLLSQKTIWLSTAGAGVAWLHIRLDQKPKYFGFRKYVV